MKKLQKRALNKHKLHSFEWSDEAIEKCNDAGPDFFAKHAISESKDLAVINTMEAKIERVQMRMKEAEERLGRKKKLDALSAANQQRLAELLPLKFRNPHSQRDAIALSHSLNAYFLDYFQRLPSIVSSYDECFPLHFFASDDCAESLRGDYKEIEFGSCLLYQPLRNDEDVVSKIGKWYPCRVISIDDNTAVVQIEGPILQQIVKLSQFQLCLANYNPQQYARLVLDACIRRNNCVGLMRYHSLVRNMPINLRIASTLTAELGQKIYDRAANSKGLREISSEVAEVELDEAKAEYEFVMNLLLMGTTIMAAKNRSLLRSLNLSMSLLSLEQRPYIHKTIETPSFNFKGKSSYHRMSSYLGSIAAIKSLHAALRENKAIEGHTILKIMYNKPFTLEKFDRYIIEQLVSAARMIKQDWPVKSGQAVRMAISRGQEQTTAHDCIQYDIGLRNVFELENSNNPIKSFLERLNFMMSDVLSAIVERSVLDFTSMIEDLCSCQIEVHDIRDIRVVVPPQSFYKVKCAPPLFIVAFRVASEDRCLNLQEIEQNKREISAWMKTKEAESGEKCPIKTVSAVMGKSFEYSTSPQEYKDSITKSFKHIVTDFLDVPHVQKFVMEKIYFPSPRCISSLSLELPWIKALLVRVESAVDRAISPLNAYLLFFKKYEKFVNIDNASYIGSRIQVHRRDPESTEMELPVSVNLVQVKSLLEEHYISIKDIEDSLPITPVECGLFLVDVVSIRNLLLEKHRAIINTILHDHYDRCKTITEYLDDEFRQINKNLSKRPENIEQLTELEEYIAGLGNTVGVLQNFIVDMMAYQDVLEVYKYKTDLDSGSQRWAVFAFPQKIATKCAEVQESNLAIKRRFKDEMMGEQATFLRSVHELDQQVAGLESLVDLSDVVNVAAVVKEVESRLIAAQAKVKLFNSRETLFEQDITDYEELNRIQRSFEPYLNLWQTAKDWIELSTQWKKGRFVDLNAEDVEKNVEKFNIAITKASKYFVKADMKHQSLIATKIKTQVSEFLPEVPMIVTLRNPGMRDRHWQKIAEQLQVDILPIENFSTEQIIAMNLKDSLELIQKIGESAAKEYQIEKALDKMEREWDNMMLNIVSYRETGTGVLRGIDDINVVLDEQITMTQVRFSQLCSTNVATLLISFAL